MSHCLEPPQPFGSKRRLDDDDTDDNVGSQPETERPFNFSAHGEPKKRELSPYDGVTLLSLSVSPLSDRGPLSPALFRVSSPFTLPQSPKTWKASVKRACSRFWSRNRGVVLVAAAQLFGAVMNLAARLLELEGEGMHPFQILFARMSLTAILCCLYMYFTKVQDFPLGAREVRGLLVLRGVSGFVSAPPRFCCVTKDHMSAVQVR
jgi:hypothetical protein